VEINNLIYAQCVTYIDSEEGKTLDHDMWTGRKTLRGWRRHPWWAQGKGGAPSYVGWAVHTQNTAQLHVQD
jgi:hypothetical protein